MQQPLNNKAIGIILLAASISSAEAHNSDDSISAISHKKASALAGLAGQIHWPVEGDMQGANIHYRLCIYRDQSFAKAVEHTLESRHVKGMPVEVLTISKPEKLKQCHVAYLGQTEEQLSQLTDSRASGSAVLVSSETHAAQSGIHLQMNVNQDQDLSFEVNLQAFAKTGQELSVGFTKLAEKVYPVVNQADDEPNGPGAQL